VLATGLDERCAIRQSGWVVSASGEQWVGRVHLSEDLYDLRQTGAWVSPAR